MDVTDQMICPKMTSYCMKKLLLSFLQSVLLSFSLDTQWTPSNAFQQKILISLKDSEQCSLPDSAQGHTTSRCSLMTFILWDSLVSAKRRSAEVGSVNLNFETSRCCCACYSFNLVFLMKYIHMWRFLCPILLFVVVFDLYNQYKKCP